MERARPTTPACDPSDHAGTRAVEAARRATSSGHEEELARVLALLSRAAGGGGGRRAEVEAGGGRRRRAEAGWGRLAFPSAETGGAHTPPLRRHAILPTYLMASSAAEPAPPPPPLPGSASTRSGSTPVLFVMPSGVPTIAATVEKIGNRRDLTHGFHPDRCSKQAMEDQYMEDIAFGARFDDTDDEEKNENDDSVLADYEGEDLPTIEWNREDPQLAKGTVFQTMMDCRNAITTYHILTKNNYEVIKSEPVDPAFGMEDQAGAANAEENEAAIQLEIEAVQHEVIEAANAEEIEAEMQRD
ncbi:hypothetical protein QYE76_071957 [Lolium multiflorum]|uniref:Uncharacterized protein n=1 Tax=Lolium multiflorum TaxID=4521 RepID=A0AAD8UWP2_LOLMU|nr:hypothetical protein QYE76_071957 [Lolium multiflorum]